MSSKDYERRTRMSPYLQKIRITNEQRSRRRPPVSCTDCKDTSNTVKFVSGKVNRIEEIVHGIGKILPKKRPEFSIYNAKFTLNNVPCELEYDLSNFTLEELQKLVDLTIQNPNKRSP